MVALVDEAAIRRHIESLIAAARDSELAVKSAQRWPWKRDQVRQLQYELSQTKVVIGINCCTVGDSDRAKAAFVDAICLAAERFAQIPRVFLGYHDVQVIAAGFIARDEATASAAIRAALRVSTEVHERAAVQTPNAAARSLLGWAVRDASAVTEAPAATKGSHFEQFEIWNDIARAGIGRDGDGLRQAFEALVNLVAKEVRSGEFRYSEDRLSYLPGQLIVKLAARDGFSLQPPQQAWWKPCM